MWLEVPSEDFSTGTYLLTCRCGSLEIDYYCSGPTVDGEYMLDVVCTGCLRTGSISFPSCGRQSGRVQ